MFFPSVLWGEYLSKIDSTKSLDYNLAGFELNFVLVKKKGIVAKET